MSIGRKGVVKAAQAEFDERTGGKSYQSLCEKDGPVGGHRPEHHEGHDQALMGITEIVNNKQKKER